MKHQNQRDLLRSDLGFNFYTLIWEFSPIHSPLFDMLQVHLLHSPIPLKFELQK